MVEVVVVFFVVFSICKNSTITRSVFFFNFSSFLTVYLLFKCRFVAYKGISPKIYILCVRVKINKRSFEPFCVWILSWNANRHSVSFSFFLFLFFFFSFK